MEWRHLPLRFVLAVSGRSVKSLKYVKTSRGRIAYADRGRGQAVVLIHGSVSDLRIWQPIVPALARHYRVIAYSRRHHWPNPPPFDEYSYVRDVDDLAEILRALGISAAHLVAHSAGGYVAVEFAKKYPKKAPSLTLFDANARGILNAPEAAAVSSELEKWLGPVRSFLAAGDDKAAMRCLLEPLFQGTKLPRWFASMASENLDSLKRQFASTLPAPSINCAQFRRYPGSTLVLQGERSPHAFKTVNEAFHRCARNAQFTTIERCGHIFQVDAPAKVLGRILQFFNTKSD
jgi:non-heme chloroperoxidase